MTSLAPVAALAAALAATLPAALAASPALAADLPPGIAGARLVDGWAEPDGSRRAALVVELQPGWKTYWRAPGEAGVPPMLDWGGSVNLGAVAIDWPAPEMFHTAGLVTLGYHDRMVLPLRLTIPDADAPTALHLHADLGLCRDICVPVALDLAADLPGASPEPETIRTALAQVPRPGPAPAGCSFAPVADGTRVTARFDPPPVGVDTAVIETSQPEIWVAPAEMMAEGRALILAADLIAPTARPFDADPAALVFTLMTPDGAVETRGCP